MPSKKTSVKKKTPAKTKKPAKAPVKKAKILKKSPAPKKEGNSSKKSTKSVTKFEGPGSIITTKVEGTLLPSEPVSSINPDLQRILQEQSLELAEAASLGATVGTLAAKFSIPYNTFSAWVRRGKADFEEHGSEEPYSPYKELWLILSRCWSQTRLLAEANVARNDPNKFLTSKTSRLLGDDHVEKAQEADDEKKTLEIGNDMIESLKLLRGQGYDLNQIIDSGTLELRIEPPTEQELAVEKQTKPKKHLCLPGPLAEAADQLETLLGIDPQAT